MDATSTQRRLVKSPPELWEKVSDPTLLGEFLEPFGEITITRLEPETTVAWEGERASGTVQLAPAGWGTSVTLTAEPADSPQQQPKTDPLAPAAPEPQPEPAPLATAEPEPP